MAPHAGLVYSGQCAAHVFGRVTLPPTVVLVGPNHRRRVGSRPVASLWSDGGFETPLGTVQIDAALAHAIETASPLVADDPVAHDEEHCLEVELPFLQVLAPDTRIVPLLLAWDDWDSCRRLAETLARAVTACAHGVLLIASSDMTHYESAAAAERKDRVALARIEQLDGAGLLETCHREHITMCGRAAAATVAEAARLLGATRADLVDYRNSGWVTGDVASVVAYAGLTID